MNFILQSLLMLSSFIFIFVFEQQGFGNLTPQLIGLMVFVFIILTAGKRKKFALGGPIGVFVLNTVIFLIIFATGGISSSFFFVLYFLVFGIAFVFEPALAFVFAAGALIVFLPNISQGNIFENVVKVGSLLLISPLAYFFGNMFKKEDKNQDEMVKLKERSNEAANTISKDVSDVLKEEKATLKNEDVEKLNEVLEETADLREEKKEL